MKAHVISSFGKACKDIRINYQPFNQGTRMDQCRKCPSDYLDYCLLTPDNKPEGCLANRRNRGTRR